MNTKLFSAALLAALTLAACGGGAPAQPKGPISEDRTTAFKSMMPEFSSMGKMVKGEEPAKNLSPSSNLTTKATAAPCLRFGLMRPNSKPKRTNSPLPLRN